MIRLLNTLNEIGGWNLVWLKKNGDKIIIICKWTNKQSFELTRSVSEIQFESKGIIYDAVIEDLIKDIKTINEIYRKK